MSAAQETSEPRALERWRPSRADALDLLAEARADIADAEAAICMLFGVLGGVCSARVERPADLDAERRVLGAMLLGRVSAGDVRSLSPHDFEGPGHADLFLYIVSAAAVLHVEEAGAHRRIARANLIERVFADEPAAQDALDALATLPWPATCPRDEIALVRALGRWRRGER